MAYVINPDGTITTVEADYDRNGNLKPKIDSVLLNDQSIKFGSNTLIGNAGDKSRNVAPKKKTPKRIIKPSKRQSFLSTTEIDFFFKDKYASGKRITTEEFKRITESLPPGLKEYFIKRYTISISKRIITDDDPRKRKTFKKPKNQKKAKNKKKITHEVKNVNKGRFERSGFSLAEVAKVSSLHKRTPEGDMVNGKSLKGASRNPKYGYARDRFGRVQERDSFNEERKNEFYNETRRQSNYDYSSYDADDDHDGAYSGWE